MAPIRLELQARCIAYLLYNIGGTMAHQEDVRETHKKEGFALYVNWQ